MGRLLVVIIPLALLIYAFIDCVRTPEESMPSGIPKPLWLVLIIFPVLGPLAWILISRIARAASTSPSGRSVVWSSETPRRPVRRPGPVAPDDDPEFLARLAREQRRAQRAQRAAGDADDAASPADAGDVRPGRATERGSSTGHLGTSGQSSPEKGTSKAAGADGTAEPDPDEGRGAPGTDANPNGTHT